MDFKPENSYISVSASATEKLKERGLFWKLFGNDNFDDIRKCVVAAFSDGSMEEDKKLSFWVTTRMSGVDVAFRCSASDGSPAGNKAYTVIVQEIITLEAFQSMGFEKKGLALLKSARVDVGIRSKDLKIIRQRIARLSKDIKKRNDRNDPIGDYLFMLDEHETLNRVFSFLESILGSLE